MTDNVCDSWEDIDVDSIVIKPLGKQKKLTKRPVTMPSNDFIIEEKSDKVVVNNPDSGMLTNGATITPRIMQRVESSDPSQNIFNQPKVVLEDSTRTQFVRGLRILNRPNREANETNKENKSADEIQKQLMRSFEEKQAEYAKARLRILGEEMPNKDQLVLDVADSLTQVTLDSSPSPTSSPVTKPCSSAKVNKTKVSAIGPCLTVIREPTAPDGTRGFRYTRYANS